MNVKIRKLAKGGNLITADNMKIKGGSTQDMELFVLPGDMDALVTYLTHNAHLFSPSNENAKRNLSALTRAFNDCPQSLISIIEKFIVHNSDNASELSNWLLLFMSLSDKERDVFSTQIIKLDEMIEVAANALQLTVINLDAAHFERAKVMFEESNEIRGKDYILTEVEYTPTISMMIAQSLGTKYDILKMIGTETQLTSNARRELHVALTNFINIHNTAKKFDVTKNGILHILEAKPKKEFPVMMNALNNIIITYGIPEANVFTPQTAIYTKSKVKSPNQEPNLADLRMKAQDEAKQIATFAINAIDEVPKKRTILLTKIAAWIVTKILSDKTLRDVTAEVIQSESQNKKSKIQSSIMLDQWQKDMIKAIREGQSVLTITPTSGGKTFIAMSALEFLLGNDKDAAYAYVAPSFDLAFQTYNNVRNTFPSHKISIITDTFSEISVNTRVWIGTPTELYTYLSTTGITFDIGFFDEIHTISTSFNDDKPSVIRSSAIGNLIVLCRKQIIALSATIHEEDEKKLIDFITTNTKIKITKENIIKHTQRSVPQTKYQWIGNGYIPESEIKSEMKLCPVTPQATFAFLEQVVRNNHTPVFAFDTTPKICYNNYIEYIKVMQSIDAAEYVDWHQLHKDTIRIIDDYNKSIGTLSVEYESHNGKNTTTFQAIRSKAEINTKNRRIAATLVISKIKEAIVKCLARSSTYVRPLSNIDMDIISSANIPGSINELKIGTLVPVPLHDLLDLLDKYSNNVNDVDINLSPLKQIANTVGPYFRIGGYQNDIEDIRAMLSPYLASKREEGNQLRVKFLALCEAERIRVQEVGPLLELICQGLEFGIGIIVPTMPFAVHYNMLRLLNKRSIPVIFASRDMSMGINYPIKTVCIRSNELIDMNVCEYLQMAGRSGRRGLDQMGNVVSWNIRNAATANQDTLPYVTLPPIGPKTGCQIADPLTLAMEIERGRFYANPIQDSDTNVAEGLTAAISKLQYTTPNGDVGKASKLPTLNDDESESKVDDVDSGDDEYNFKKPKIKSLPKTKSTSLTPMDDDTLISAVIGCVSPVTSAMNLSSSDIIELSTRIQSIALGINTANLSEDSYKWAELMGLVKSALQELHTKLHLCSNTAWLDYIASIYELLHRVELRQIRL